MIVMKRRPRKILIIPDGQKGKEKLSKEDKLMLSLNPAMLEAIKKDKLYARDRRWVEDRL